MNEIFDNIFNAARKPVDYTKMNEKVSIAINDDVMARIKQMFAGEVKSLIMDRGGFNTLVDFPSLTVHELLTERQRKDIAVFLFGSDWPSSVEALKGLKVVVEGYCPDCGRKLNEGFDMTLPQTSEHEAEGKEYEYCEHCGYCEYKNYV